jgi:hypothetical protein
VRSLNKVKMKLHTSPAPHSTILASAWDLFHLNVNIQDTQNTSDDLHGVLSNMLVMCKVNVGSSGAVEGPTGRHSQTHEGYQHCVCALLNR